MASSAGTVFMVPSLQQNSAPALWAALGVSSYDSLVEVLRSALRHGIPSEDIHHALIEGSPSTKLATTGSAGWSSGQTGPGTCSNWR